MGTPAWSPEVPPPSPRRVAWGDQARVGGRGGVRGVRSLSAGRSGPLLDLSLGGDRARGGLTLQLKLRQFCTQRGLGEELNADALLARCVCKEPPARPQVHARPARWGATGTALGGAKLASAKLRAAGGRAGEPPGHAAHFRRSAGNVSYKGG